MPDTYQPEKVGGRVISKASGNTQAWLPGETLAMLPSRLLMNGLKQTNNLAEQSPKTNVTGDTKVRARPQRS